MRIGTRASALALAQAELVGRLLRECDAVAEFELVKVSTSGDRASAAGDKSRWVDGLERALLNNQIDIAVHSAKDVPAQLADGLDLLGAPQRAAAEDVICGASSLDELSPRARVGTSSLRRAAQLRAARDDLDIVSLRGNVDTRLRKLAAGELAAIVLARAGLQRLERDGEAGAALDPARFVPAPGQGALALEARQDDQRTREAAAAIVDEQTTACVAAERALSRELGASCRTPLGAHAAAGADGRLRLRAWVGLPDGSRWLCDERSGERRDPEALARELARRLEPAGGREILRAAQEQAGAV